MSPRLVLVYDDESDGESLNLIDVFSASEVTPTAETVTEESGN